MSPSSPSDTPQAKQNPTTRPVSPSAAAPFLFRSLMNSLPDHIYFKDVEGRFLAVSDALAAAFSLTSPEQAIGKTDFDFFDKHLANQKLEDERNVIRTGQGFVGKEERSRSTCGKVSWVMTSKLPLLGDNNEIIGTFGISRDITEMKVARDALEAHHRLLETLIDLLPCRVFIKDSDGRIQLVNTAYRQAMGIPTMAEIEGRRLSELTKDRRADHMAADDKMVLEQGLSILNREEYDASPLSINRWMLLSKVPLRDADGQIRGVVGMAADITMQKEAEARALNAQRELAAKNQQMEADLDVARELQTELMASSVQSVREELSPTLSFVPSIGFHYEPCEFLAGDFFQAIPYSGTSFGLLLCDVMGHGVKAALVTTLIRGLLADVRSKALSPAQVLEHLNERLCPLLDRPPLPRFVTALYARFDLLSSVVEVASAGHPWPLLQHHRTGAIPIAEEQCGPALGLLPGVLYPSSVHKLTKGDRVLLFTDGWIEEPDPTGQEFGLARVRQALNRHRDTPVEKTLTAIAAEVAQFSGKPARSDDLCGLLVGL